MQITTEQRVWKILQYTHKLRMFVSNSTHTAIWTIFLKQLNIKIW